MDWIKETFGTHKPIVAMCHVRALPGDPYFDADGGMEKLWIWPVRSSWLCRRAAWMQSCAPMSSACPI